MIRIPPVPSIPEVTTGNRWFDLLFFFRVVQTKHQVDAALLVEGLPQAQKGVSISGNYTLNFRCHGREPFASSIPAYSVDLLHVNGSNSYHASLLVWVGYTICFFLWKLMEASMGMFEASMEAVEAPIEEVVEASAKSSLEVSVEASIEAHTEASTEAVEVSIHAFMEVVEDSVQTSMEASMESSTEASSRSFRICRENFDYFYGAASMETSLTSMKL